MIKKFFPKDHYWTLMWVRVNSGSWWWTGRSGVLRFTGSQRVRHNWATELNWIDSILKHKKECTKKQCLTQYYKKSFIDYIVKIKGKKNLFLGMCDSQLEFFKIRLQFVKPQQQRKGTHRNITTTTFSKLCGAPVAYILTVQNTFPKTSLDPHEKPCE